MGIKAGSAPENDEIEVSIFGPGFGECIVAHLGNGDWIVVDSCLVPGTTTPVALKYFEGIGLDPTCVKLVVLTHWHSDHIAGAAQLIEKCKPDKICVPAAFRAKEFAEFVASHSDLNADTRKSASAEILAIFKAAADQQIALMLAVANRCIFQAEDDGIKIVLTSLSPSDAQVFQSLLEFSNDVMPTGKTKIRIAPHSPNNNSIVLHLSVNETAILLGGDLEITANNDSGWQAIVDSTEKPTQKADLFKIPHHGSANGHHDQVWDDMLEDKPIAVATPYSKGKKLPTNSDIDRIEKVSGEFYLTSPPLGHGKQKHDYEVEKFLKDFGFKFHRNLTQLGHVRARKTSPDVKDWVVEE